MRDVTETLDEREDSHGDFFTVGIVAQQIKHAFRQSPNWHRLPAYQREALELMATKFARILNGDNCHADHWHDIAGYARLPEMILTEDAG